MPKTIDVSYRVAEADGKIRLTKKESREFLEIRHRRTFNQACESLNITAPFTWEDLKKLFALRSLLAYERGNKELTREVMAWLVNNNKHEQALRQYNFDLNTEFNRRKNEFCKRYKWAS